ncbi:MAG: DNA mismatch repair protein MutT, partial [Gammaproteobacteria bacterium]|nr:DNA mismatch repair protein MutT [Gammaproteobacteria bacterium]
MNEILVVKTSVLFEDKQFEGFLSRDDFDLTKTVLKHYEYQKRTDELEEDPSFQQIISYCWVVNPKEKTVLLYRRAADENYDDARLRNKLSCGV